MNVQPKQDVTQFPLFPEKGAKISFIANSILAGLVVVAAAGVVVSAVLFFHSGLSLALTGLIVSSIALSILSVTLLYPTIESHLPSWMQAVGDRVAGVGKEIFAVPLLIGAMAIQGIFGKQDEAFDQEGDPILLIHGYAGTSAHLVYIKYHLKKNNAGAVFTIDLGNPFLSIDDYVQRVTEKFEEIKKHYPDKTVTLIGHSMGGIVASAFAAKDPTHIAQLITLGSPLQGTYMAYIGLGTCAKQMRPNSKYLQGLENKLLAPTFPITNVASKSDLIILPNESASFKNVDSKKILFPSMGHATYLFSDQMAAFLIAKIASIPAKT